MEKHLSGTVEEYVRALVARTGSSALADHEFWPVCSALHDALGTEEGERFIFPPTANTPDMDVEYRTGRRQSVMHAGMDISRPMVRLASTYFAMTIDAERADELCDLYAIAIRALRPPLAA